LPRLRADDWLLARANTGVSGWVHYVSDSQATSGA
jgi:hypothetical protein